MSRWPTGSSERDPVRLTPEVWVLELNYSKITVLRRFFMCFVVFFPFLINLRVFCLNFAADWIQPFSFSIFWIFKLPSLHISSLHKWNLCMNSIESWRSTSSCYTTGCIMWRAAEWLIRMRWRKMHIKEERDLLCFITTTQSTQLITASSGDRS